ncbi:MAG TPA: hypothetical protein VFD91_09105 [Mariniphaga sp.]|nr:hypothetical protein [Mariniphaga sp.]
MLKTKKNEANESFNRAKDNLSNIDKTANKLEYKSAKKDMKVAQR